MRLYPACKYCAEFRQARPDTPIYAFNILMRLAVTLSSDAAVSNYYNNMRYARLADEAGRFESDYLREQLQNVIAEIPPQVLQDYRAARARQPCRELPHDRLAGRRRFRLSVDNSGRRQ
jgi:hypothetical protein